MRGEKNNQSKQYRGARDSTEMPYINASWEGLPDEGTF